MIGESYSLRVGGEINLYKERVREERYIFKEMVEAIYSRKGLEGIYISSRKGWDMKDIYSRKGCERNYIFKESIVVEINILTEMKEKKICI